MLHNSNIPQSQGQKTSDVVIVGGGVIGCSIAYYLAKAGIKATVVERGRIGGEASSVAAGMLAPLAEAHGPGPMLELGLKSLDIFMDLAQELRAGTGVDIEYVPSGILRAALTEEEAEELKGRLAWFEDPHKTVQWLEGEEVHQLEPELSSEITGALYSPYESHVRSGQLVEALALAAARLGASFREGTPVAGLTAERNRVLGVHLAHGESLAAGQVILAAGPWTELLGEGLGIRLPLRPVRGQILAVRAIPSPVQRVVFTSRGYLVPKVDGTILVGATQDEVGFDKRVTAGGIGGLLRAVPRLAPSLAQGEFLGAWAGLRPGSGDGLPILGSVPGWEGLLVAAGHFRNGILLSPITGQLMAELVSKGKASLPLEPFSPKRFTNG